MVCDFAPLEVSGYYSELFKNLRTKGTILASYTSAEYALHKGRYEIIRRNTGKVAEEIYKAFKENELEYATSKNPNPNAIPNPNPRTYPNQNSNPIYTSIEHPNPNPNPYQNP